MRHLFVPIIIFGALAACAESPSPEYLPDQFGVAVRTNMEAQIITGQDEVTTLGPAPGERRALAVGRYQTDQVEQPIEVYTRGGE